MLGDSDVVERPVQLPVSAAIEAMSRLVLPGGRLDRRGAAEPGEGGFAVAAAGMGPGDVELGCGDVADAALGEQLRCGLVEQFFERPVVVVDLGVEVLDASTQCPKSDAGAALFDGRRAAVTEPRAGGDLLAGA